MPNHVTNIVTITGEKGNIDEIINLLSTEVKEENFKGELTGETFIRDFDFNKIIPMPESLRITSGSATDYAVAIISYTEHGDASKLKSLLSYSWMKNDIDKAVKEEEEYQSASDEEKEKMRLDKAVEILRKSQVKDKAMKEGKTALENKKKYGHQDWYSWSNDKWGTKWNAYNSKVNRVSDETVVYEFDTAWACPVPVLEELSSQFPDVLIKVRFADEDFGSNCGELKFSNGFEVEQNIPDYGFDSLKLASDVLDYGLSYFVDIIKHTEKEELYTANDEFDEDSYAFFCLSKLLELSPEELESEEVEFWVFEEIMKLAVLKEEYEIAENFLNHLKEKSNK